MMQIFSHPEVVARNQGIASNIEKRGYSPSWVQELTSAIMKAGSAGTTSNIVNEQMALTVSPVWSAIRVLSEIQASLTLGLKEVSGEFPKKILSGPIARCLIKPNSFQTAFVFWQSMLIKMYLRGNAYAFIKRTQGKVELIPIYYDDVTILLSAGGDKVFYQINGQTFTSDEIFHIKLMSLDGIIGLSPIHYASRMLNNAVDSERYMNKVYESGILTSGFFTTIVRLNKTSYERLKTDLGDKSGIERAGEALILDSGLKFERNTLSAADSQILENMQFGVEDVARIWRVPKHLLYLDAKGGSTRSFATQAREFLTYSLAPTFENHTQELEKKLLSTADYEAGTRSISHDTKALLRVDPEVRAKYYRDLFNIGSITPNEIRAEEGRGPVDGGDTTYIQLNLVPMDKIDEIIADKVNKQINSTN